MTCPKSPPAPRLAPVLPRSEISPQREMSLPERTSGPRLDSRIRSRRVFGFDTETFYARDYCVKKLGVDRYVAGKRFDCYLVSFWGPHGQFVGHPKDCPWEEFSGCVWVSHNSRFDRAVFSRLQELGIIPPEIAPAEWHDTAALATFLQAPRGLEGACRELIGKRPDKSVRAQMKGVDWIQARTLLQDDRVLEYALEDARLACELWLAHADKWPTQERILSRLTVEQGEHGIQLDRVRIEAGIQALSKQCEESAQALPWHGKEKPTSTKALAFACREINLPPPPSTAEDNPACDEWQERYGNRAPWIRHIRNWRKSNRMLRVLETMRDRCRPDGSLPFSLKYFGAIATGRWSGDAGLNLQNFNREPLHGVDPRRCLIARPGHKLLIADLSQIEPRVLAWMAGDFDLLEKIRGGLTIYQAHAETLMGFTGANLKKEDPRRYLLAKCRVIGLGYGAGAKTFQNLAKTYGLEITLAEAKATVDDFRAANPRITGLWRNLENEMRSRHGHTFFVRLPSGRVIRYFNVHAFDSGITAATERGGRRFEWYGGKLTENVVQATARDVFAEGLLRIHQAGIRILWTVHDEVICEVPEDPEVTPDIVTGLLAQTPTWMPGLPVAAEGIETQTYCK